jgi:long-chain acyl-CoA synthetase
VPNRTDYDLSSLVALVHAGAPCPAAHKQAMIDWLGPIVWEYLGSTEGGWVSIVGPQEWLTRPGTVGKPAPGTTVKILDETGTEVPTGEAGTIYVRNARSNFVYHNDPAKTARSRVGAFATSGDIGRLDADGYLYILDRRDDLILSGGANIYPAEIEARLITHPAVRDVAVIGIADPEWGQSVLAVVQLANVAAAGAELAESLRAYCAEALASYKCPRRFEFRTEFPRTAAGKLQRRVLRDIYNAKHDQGLNP